MVHQPGVAWGPYFSSTAVDTTDGLATLLTMAQIPTTQLLTSYKTL